MCAGAGMRLCAAFFSSCIHSSMGFLFGIWVVVWSYSEISLQHYCQLSVDSRLTGYWYV